LTTTEAFRAVRSFVRREGRITAAQKRALAELEPKLGLGGLVVSATSQPFSELAPLELEIGCGNGDALIEMATARSEHNFIGVEVYRPGLGKLLQGIETAGLNNVRVSSRDATELVRDNLAPECLHRVMVFFPDPWPKKKHNKRRILNSEFMALLTDRLQVGGELHMATDWQDYAEWIVDAAGGVHGLEFIDPATVYSPRPASRPLTKYEQRGTRLGHEVFDIIMKRVA
jgi:tRNA (guanine-N7-)-methyltransferase